MKTNLFSFALGLVMLMAACQKDDVSALNDGGESFAPPPSERCGCLPPVAFEALNVTDVSAKILWNAMPEAIAYRIEVSSEGFNAADDGFASIYVFEISESNHMTLTNLAPSTRYLYRVTTICGNSESSVSELMFFETKDPVHGDPGYKFQKVYKEGHVAVQ